MIDGIKICNLGVTFEDLKSLILFPLNIDEDNGVAFNEQKRFAEYESLKFIYSPKNKSVKLKGSLHKFFNNGKHNHNDFHLEDILLTIDYLVKHFQINPVKSIINNLEFGINITLPFDPDRVINSLICHKRNAFVKMPYRNGNGKICNTNEYIIKVYNKTKQYNLSENILRFEIKVTRMHFLTAKDIIIQDLTDLIKFENFKRLMSLLLLYYDDILLFEYDSMTGKRLTYKDEIFIKDARNTDYWERTRPNTRDYVSGCKSPDYKKRYYKYQRELKRFKAIIDKYTPDNLKTQVRAVIQDKIDYLLNITDSTQLSAKQVLRCWENNTIY